MLAQILLPCRSDVFLVTKFRKGGEDAGRVGLLVLRDREEEIIDGIGRIAVQGTFSRKSRGGSSRCSRLSQRGKGVEMNARTLSCFLIFSIRGGTFPAVC